MDLITEYADPEDLSGFARASLADREVNQFTLSRYLKSQEVNDVEFRAVRGSQGLVEAGQYRTWDTEAPLLDHPGIERVFGSMAPMSIKSRVGEFVRLKQRQLTGEIQQEIFNAARRGANALAARVELARGDALVNGKVTITNENGVNQVVDFGRKSSMSVTPSDAAWDSTGDPIKSLLTWRDAYVDENGSEPGTIVTSRKVLSALMGNTKLRAYAFPNGANAPTTITPVDINRVLNAYGLPDIELYDVKVTVGGSATRVIDDAKVLLLPAVGSEDASQLGSVFWGTTAESLMPEYGGVGAGMVAGVYSKRDPVSVYTLVSGVNMPVLVNPNLAMVADVLS